ncbi:MAG: protein kinase [Myxococcaceae bacterium]|nr:protein kinase [Myxococcaceae bacterium]
MSHATPHPPLEPTSASQSGLLRPGSLVLQDRFKVLEVLGKGGMGEVYLAEQVSLGRKVALKTLRDDLATQPGMTDRFKREALLLSSVDHPSVVRVIDFGEAAGTYVLVMEFVEGDHLAAALREGPFEPARALRVLRDIAEGLAEIHAKGIVHRDLKLENVLLAKDRARLLDFGIARLAEAEGPGQAMTQAGMVLGTPEYLSPEQATGERIDARTDVYAFGILAYRLLAGHHPFPGPTARDFLLQHVSSEPAPLKLDAAPVLASVVMKCLAKKPYERPEDGKGLLEALQAVDGAAAPIAHTVATPRRAPAQRAMLVGKNVSLLAVTLRDFASRSTPELLSAREQKVLGVIRAAGGRVISVLQDQVLATFELPSQAVGCGMAIQDALWRWSQSATTKLEAASTVHQGEVVISGESLLGEPAQVLTELARLTATGDVRLTRAAWLSMAKNGVQVEEQGEVTLASRAEAVKVYRCRPTGPGAPFGGRDLNLENQASLLGRLLK